jgi:hypothetical protein
MSMKQRIVWALILMAGLGVEASAQQVVDPAKEQTPEKQKSDEAACPDGRRCTVK